MFIKFHGYCFYNNNFLTFVKLGFYKSNSSLIITSLNLNFSQLIN